MQGTPKCGWTPWPVKNIVNNNGTSMSHAGADLHARRCAFSGSEVAEQLLYSLRGDKSTTPALDLMLALQMAHPKQAYVWGSKLWTCCRKVSGILGDGFSGDGSGLDSPARHSPAGNLLPVHLLEAGVEYFWQERLLMSRVLFIISCDMADHVQCGIDGACLHQGVRCNDALFTPLHANHTVNTYTHHSSPCHTAKSIMTCALTP